MIVILSTGLEMLVDDDAPPEVCAVKWYPQRNRDGKIYARRILWFPGNIRQHVRAHRVIANAAPGQIVDHINGDTLDNRRANLRLTDATGNSRNNKHTRRMKVGKLKGVNQHGSRFHARIGSGGRINLGCYSTELEAGLAYDKAARAMYGEFAALNFPDGERK